MKNIIKRIKNNIVRYNPFCITSQYEKWFNNRYLKRINDNLEDLFIAITKFCQANRPISGYYFEFGCHSGRTMRMAWRNFRWLFDWEYVAFDSFEGLPTIEEYDKQEIWKKGTLKTPLNKFRTIMQKARMPKNKLRIVKGFYGESLTDELKARLQPKKAAVIYIDCDLYKSTSDVMKFIKDFLQPGTILFFDDWNCYLGNPDKGERKAFAEFCQMNPSVRFEEFRSTFMGKAFICIEPGK